MFSKTLFSFAFVHEFVDFGVACLIKKILISQPKHMMFVLKRTVSMSSFGHPKHIVNHAQIDLYLSCTHIHMSTYVKFRILTVSALSQTSRYDRVTMEFLFYFETKAYVVGTPKNRLIETVLLSTHSVCSNHWMRT